MGTDMGCVVHRKTTTGWVLVSPEHDVFDWRSYGLYGFLADVRNYSKVPPVVNERRGIPADIQAVCDENDHYHSCHWLLVSELLSVDYDKTFEDRRNCGSTLPEGQGERVVLRDFLGQRYFDELEKLKDVGPPDNVRIVMWFN